MKIIICIQPHIFSNKYNWSRIRKQITGIKFNSRYNFPSAHCHHRALLSK
uniref:Uncharacterized protein n=1 Tax=Anguilla anguilla TaxID=7936 RepID=A0A0E9PWG9_ANGAN